MVTMIVVSENKGKLQFNVQAPKELVERLERLAERFKGDKKNRTEVAVEILDRYAVFWEDAQLDEIEYRARQRERARAERQLNFQQMDASLPTNIREVPSEPEQMMPMQRRKAYKPKKGKTAS